MDDVLACKPRCRANLAALDVEDTLVLILERIDSLVTLIRAASTSRRWRRVIADAGFLRRWRSLHGPPVAGDYYADDATSRPWFVPSSSTIDARHFSLNFVVNANIFPSPRGRDLVEFEPWGWKSDMNPSWKLDDSRGSLLLMTRINKKFLPSHFPDLVVCEPVTRRYRIIPRPPDFNDGECIYHRYLVDGDEEDEAGGRIGMSNFKVHCMIVSFGGEAVVVHTTMFTVGSCANTDSTWSKKVIDNIALRLVDPNVESCYLGRVLGSSYFYVDKDGTLITHDGSTGKFSSSVLFLDIKTYWHGDNLAQNFSIIDGGYGEPRIVTLTKNHKLKVFARVDGQWGLEKKVRLSNVTRGLPGYRRSLFKNPLTIMRTGVGFIVISLWDPKVQQWWPFSVDLKTMEVAPATLGFTSEMMGYRVSSRGHQFCKFA